MRGLVITGGHIDLDFASDYIKKNTFDLVITADKGLFYAKKLGIIPDVILGDFDSCDVSILDEYDTKDKTLFPCEKDDTDTGLSIKRACDMGISNLTILGATGTRLDHVLGNLGQLVYARNCGVKAEIIDANNRITLAEPLTQIEKKNQFGTYISLLPMGEVNGVTLKGFYYPLNNDTLKFQETWGISNELVDDVGEISYADGVLFLIESRD